MILPGSTSFKGIIGTTFDAFVTVYLLETPLAWQEPLLWNPATKYVVHAAVVASNGSAYKALIENTNVYPVEDKTGTWELIEPLNLTGYKAKMRVSKALVLEEGGKGLTNGGALGTISIEMTPEQTEKQTGNENYALLLTTPAGKLYEYLKGAIEWVVQ